MTAAIHRLVLAARYHLQLAMLRTRHTQLGLLRMRLELYEPDPVPLLHCNALISQVQLDMLLLKQRHARRYAA